MSRCPRPRSGLRASSTAVEATRVNPFAEPTWAEGARRARITYKGHVLEVVVADTPERRRLGWSHATPAGPLVPVLFSFDDDALHAFWMRDVGFDLDLLYVDVNGFVQSSHRLHAGSSALVAPPTPVCYGLELEAGSVERLGIAVGDRLVFARDDVRPLPAPLEPAITPDPHDDPALVLRWSQRSHLFSNRRFATAAAAMNWPMAVGPHDTAIWRHAGGAFVLHPAVCALGPLAELTQRLGLGWLRLELAPHARLALPDGSELTEVFDPREPAAWIARMAAHGLVPTLGRWQFTRCMVVDIEGPIEAAFKRQPARIRYEVRAFQRGLEANDYRVEAVPRLAFDQRQERALVALHAAWMEARPGAFDNLVFCRPLAIGLGDAMTAYLCWQGPRLLAVQFHVLWEGSLYYLFSEAVADPPIGLTPGLLWHGVVAAKRAPYGPSGPPDLIDLLEAFDPRYPDFRAYGRGFTASKQRWHPTSVWLPPAMAFAGTEAPP